MGSWFIGTINPLLAGLKFNNRPKLNGCYISLYFAIVQVTKVRWRPRNEQKDVEYLFIRRDSLRLA